MQATIQPSNSSRSEYNKNNPFKAKVVERQRLNKPHGQKETIHCVIDISGSGIQYQSGDSIGVFPANNPILIQEIIEKLGFSGKEQITLPKKESTVSFLEALTYYKDIHEATKKIVEALASRATEPSEAQKLKDLFDPANETQLKEYLNTHHIIDLIYAFPTTSQQLSPQDWVDVLKVLNPRLYSIASSPKKYPDEIHLTIAVVRYELHTRQREGVASTFLADRVELGLNETLPIFVTKSHFKLPEDLTKDVIMVGPGTGVAPFRAFLQEREATQASGRNWLFFGDQHRHSDFLYEEELFHYQQKGHLSHLDLAFSRDQDHKVYVQHKMLEKSQELWAWINGGAYFYVCGDAKRMAPDVEEALLTIFQKEGGMERPDAENFLKTLKKDRRYQRDVY